MTHAVFFQRRQGALNPFRGFCLCGWSAEGSDLDTIHALAATHDLDEETTDVRPEANPEVGESSPS